MFVSGRSLAQRSSIECGGPDNDNEAWIIMRPWPTRGCCAMEKSGCDEYIRIGVVQMNWHLSLYDHRRFTELINHVRLRRKFKELFVDPLNINGLNGGKL